jgi:single-strand DNA-binding protein
MVNKVILVGNLGQDPEIRYTQSGSKIANFSIATTDSWKDKSTGEKKTTTQWHRVVIFNENIANIVEQYVKKGSKIYVEGAIQNRKYTGNDGIEKNITEIVLTQFKGEVQLLDSRNQDNSYNNNELPEESLDKNSTKKSPSKKVENNNFTSVGDDLDDEIPF